MKKIVIFILAFGYILVTIFFSFYQDKLIRKRPMFSLDIAQKIAYTQEKNGIHFELVASRPNLGVIYLPIPKLDLEEQKLTINISVGTRSNYVTTAYDYRSIRDNRGFPVGMPILADSENQTIKIFIRADQINNVPYPESKMEITTRYVFSKIYLLSHPQIAYDVVMYQVKRVFANQWYLAILILGSLVLFTTDFRIWIGICFGLAILIKSSEFTILGILICTIEVLLRSKDKFLKYWWLPLLLSIFIYPWKYLGGDETRLYYTHPLEYLQNYVVNSVQISSPSILGRFTPVNVLFPFVTLLLVMNKILFFANLQLLLLVANVLGGGYFMYKFLDNLLPDTKTKNFLIKLFPWLYVFSIFNAYTIFNAQNYSQYTLFLLPFTFWIFSIALSQKTPIPILLLVLIWSLLPVYPMAPVLGAALISTLPLWIYWLIKHRLQFVKYVIIFVCCYGLINSYWLGRLNINEPVFGVDNIISDYEGVIMTTKATNPIYPLLGLFHYDIQKNNSWVQTKIFESWYLRLIPINLIILLALIFGVMIIRPRGICFFVGLSFIWTVYLFSGKLWPIGPEVFAWGVTNLPMAAMFRNMYDKFALPLGFVYVLAVSFTLNGVLERVRDEYWEKIIKIFLITFVVLNIKPVIMGDFLKLPIWTTNSLSLRMTDFDGQYYQLLDVIKKLSKESRILSLPLNRGNLALIPDRAGGNNYYLGVSPLLIFSGKNDFSGFLSFGAHALAVEEMIMSKKYEQLGNLLRDLGMTHVLVYKNIPTEIKNSYLYQGETLLNQTQDLYDELLGSSLIELNNYSLYEINPKYKGELISSGLTWVRDGLFTGRHPGKIILRETYSPDWKLISNNKEISGQPDSVFGIVWDAPDRDLKIEFVPLRKSKILYTVSIISLLSAIILIWYLKTKQK